VEALVPLAEKEGIPLPVLGVAWTLAHPAVTSAIIGPRTPDQLEGLLGAADVALSTETLDAIDGIVPPGHTLNRADLGFENVWLRPERRRRAAC
jgi:aryl-alcohol dehydrogenase-like predicted oxidoreductase